MSGHAIIIDEMSSLPELLDMLRISGKNILISRKGKPIAELVPYEASETSAVFGEKQPLIGLAEGKLNCPADIDFCNDEIEHLFYGESL
ncbi:hypothetical protein SAMN05216583_10710 [Selenomonas sp. KH1T6]|nr:hypothetical protein SAMN05216583_10710 [Selenomonas ruminantium]